MGDCKKCSTTPIIIKENRTIYICFGTEHLMIKMLLLLEARNFEYDKYSRYLIVKQYPFHQFIDEINNENTFSFIEKKEVYLLPMEKGRQFEFNQFIETKSLEYWSIFYGNIDIVNAIRKKRINTVFQPIIENKTLKLHGHEALARMHNEQGELIPNGRLFPNSKKLDLSFNLDKQCRISAIEKAASYESFKGKLFVNFMPTVIYDPEVCLRTTHDVIKATNFSPSDIVFEVVESEFVDDYNHLATILNYYRDKGYKTALDDVGSGFSTLSNFEILKTDYIKIDMNIIQKIHHSESAQNYVDHILSLKKRYNVKIIAEGIEMKETYDYLVNTDVDYLQGYYFGRPSENLYKK